MIIWVDAQLSPQLAPWLSQFPAVEAKAIREFGLRDAKDSEIFRAARKAKAVVMTKDSDFLLLLDEHGPPPQVLWITAGNTSNAFLKRLLESALPKALKLLEVEEESVVEINAAL